MTLDSDNIRLTRIFPGLPWRGGSNNSGVIEDVDFRAFGRYIGILGNEASIIFSQCSTVVRNTVVIAV